MSKAARMGMLVLALVGNSLSPAAASGAPLAADGAKKLLMSTPVADGELADVRGGFFTAAGAQFDFGATVSTTINGQLALQTNLTWTPAGPAIQQLSGLGATIQSQVASNLAKAGIADPVAPLSPANISPPATTVQIVPPPAATSAAAAAASLPGPSLASISAPAASTPASVTPAAAPVVTPVVTPVAAPAATPVAAAPAMPTTVATITNIVPSSSAASASGGAPAILTGVQLQSATGTTQVLTNIGANQLQNILVNSASNQNIVQNTNLVFTIYNFADWQKQLSQNALSAQLANQIMGAAGLGGSR